VRTRPSSLRDSPKKKNQRPPAVSLLQTLEVGSISRKIAQRAPARVTPPRRCIRAVLSTDRHQPPAAQARSPLVTARIVGSCTSGDRVEAARRVPIEARADRVALLRVLTSEEHHASLLRGLDHCRRARASARTRPGSILAKRRLLRRIAFADNSRISVSIARRGRSRTASSLGIVPLAFASISEAGLNAIFIAPPHSNPRIGF
jgi:hypothetical protein